MSRSKAALVAVTVLVLVSASAAIEINSSKSLKYYSGGDLDFKVGTDGTVDLKGGILEDSNGPLQLDAEVEIKNGNLDMTGNGIVNTGQIDGVDVDNPGDAIVLSSSRYTVPSDAIGNSELNNSQRMDLDGVTLTNSLNVNGQRVRNVPAPQGPGDAVNKSFVTLNDDTIADDQTLQDVLGQGNSAGNFNIDASSQDVYGIRRLQFADRNSDSTSFNITESGGDLVIQKDGNARLRVWKSGGIAVKNGNLVMKSNKITGFKNGGRIGADIGGTDLIKTGGSGNNGWGIWDAANSNIMFEAIEGGPITFTNPVSDNVMLRMNSSAGSDLEVPNGDFRASGDTLAVDHSSGNVGINEGNPQDRLVVRGNTTVYGNLTVSGDLVKTGQKNEIVNGSLLPEKGHSGEFDVGNATRKWRNAYFSNTGTFEGGLTVSGGTVSLPSGEVGNTELANSDITVNANSGLSGGGTPSLGGTVGLSHTDTSSQSDVSNSGGSVIQDLQFDGFGHVTTANTKNLDNRYYTESESNSNFVDASGDTMSGNLIMDGNSILETTRFSFNDSDTDGDYWRIFSYQGGLEIDNPGSTYLNSLRIKDNHNILIGQDGVANLNMNSNSITNFFDSDACPSGEVVADVQNDGTFTCQSVTDAAKSDFVDETGDSMTGYLNMTGSDIKNVGTINASSIQEGGTEIGQVYVDESGDAMSGSLNLQSNDLRRVDELRTTGGGSDVIAVRDVANSQDIARFKEGGSVEIPNGRQQIMYDAGNNVADGSLILSGTSTASDENPSLSFWLRPEDNLHGGISLISKSFGTYGAELQVKGKRGNGGVDAPFTINPKYGITTQGDQGEFTVYDDANDQYIARFKEGGNLKVPNGNFNVSGGDAEFQGSISTDSSAPHEIRIHSGNKGSFMDTQKNDVYVTDGSHPAYSDWGNLVFEAPSNKGSIVFATSNKSGGGGSVQSTLEVQEQGAVEIPNGNLNVEGSGRFNSLRGDSSGNKCGVNEFLNGNGNCQKDSNTDTDNQDLSDVLAQGERTGNQDIDLDGAELIDREGSITLGGGNVEVPGGNLDVSGNDINLNGGDILTGSGQTSQIRAVRSFSIDIDTDNNENDRVFRIQKDGLSTDLLVVRENGKVQVPNGNLDISSPYYTGSTLDVGGGANFGNSVNLNNNDLGGANVISFNDAGTDGKIEFGSGAKIYNAPLDDSNSAGYLQLVNDEGIAFEAGSDGTQTMELKSNNNVEIPNGNLDISNSDGGSIKLGGEFDEEIAFTEGSDTNTFGDIDFPDVSSSNAYIRFFRDTSTTGTAQFKVYKGDGTNTVNFAVNDNNNGNVEVPNGNLKLNHNKIENVGELNVSTSTEQIAHFSDTGVTLKQPLSVESSGPLSVSNGIELTGTSSNTISSYSTFYLETQSGSPSDIVLNPTGEVGIDANASIAGDLNMNGNDIKTGGGTVAIRDSTNGQDVLRAKEGGNIEVPNGDLDVGGEAQIGQYVSGWMLLKNQGVGDAGHALSQNSNGKTLLNSADGQPILLKNSDSTILARLNSNGDIEIPSGDLNMGGNLIKSGGGDLEIRGKGTNGVILAEGGGENVIEAGINGNKNVEIPNGNLGMNENNIQNIGAIQDGGSNAITVDNSQNVKIPNGRLYVGPNRLWVDPYSEYGSWQNDGATINTAISTNIVAGQSDNRRNINFGVGGDNISETTIGLHLNGQGDGSGSPADSVDVNIPNGALTVSGDLAVGGTECNTGEFLDGDGTCTSVTGTTNDDYVSEGGDSMTGYLNMTGSPVVNVGANNIDVGDGQGNIDMNGQRILDSSLMVADNIGVTGSASTADTETNGNDVYVQDDVKVDGDFVGAGADVAERLKTEEKIPSATVVELGANMSVEVSDSARDTAVAGVVSRDPAMIMAKERDGVPIAMSGTVPVKFSDENGGVKPGDFLTTASEDGHAMKCSNLDRCEGAIIGKAMESQAKDGEVQMMVSRG